VLWRPVANPARKFVEAPVDVLDGVVEVGGKVVRDPLDHDDDHDSHHCAPEQPIGDAASREK
jgi:hypothetical protein